MNTIVCSSIERNALLCGFLKEPSSGSEALSCDSIENGKKSPRLKPGSLFGRLEPHLSERARARFEKSDPQQIVRYLRRFERTSRHVAGSCIQWGHSRGGAVGARSSPRRAPRTPRISYRLSRFARPKSGSGRVAAGPQILKPFPIM